MNYDPMKWCAHGGHIMPRESFRWLIVANGSKRLVCEVCYARIMKKREELKEAKS